LLVARKAAKVTLQGPLPLLFLRIPKRTVVVLPGRPATEKAVQIGLRLASHCALAQALKEEKDPHTFSETDDVQSVGVAAVKYNPHLSEYPAKHTSKRKQKHGDNNLTHPLSQQSGRRL
jgi:hypothetical protein